MGKFDRLKSVTVLYVEDSKFIANTTLKSIEGIFNKVYIAYNGQEGLDILKERENEIDIVITDLVMPVLDGINMIQSIRNGGYSIPIIVTTGHNDMLALEKVIELSIDGFLSKPLDMFKLLKRVDAIVETLFVKRELNAKKEMIDNDIIYSEADERGIITYVSKPFEKISGYKRSELIGRPHSILRHESTHPYTYEEMWKNLRSLKQWQGEITNKAKDGTEYTVNIVISPMYFRNKLIGYSATSIDVTELRAASRELQFKSRQAAMGEMVAMIAHQWRQPITSIGMIAGNLEFDMMMDELDKDTVKESLGSINLHVKYLSDTIDVFRNFLSQNKRRSKVMLIDAIEEALFILRAECKEKNITLNVDNSCENIELSIFKDELVQAIINITTNAKEALVENAIKDPNITLTCRDDKDFVIIEMLDNAGGIKPDIMSKIFTPYFSTKKEKNGTGLGLYMTKTIVEEYLDGDIFVTNTDKGALFSIKLPK